MESPVDFSYVVCPICLPTESDLASTGSLAVVAGWGIQNFNCKCLSIFFPKFLIVEGEMSDFGMG